MSNVDITPAMSSAWRTLQAWRESVMAETYPQEVDLKAAEAIKILDNSDYMVPIERAEEEEREADQKDDKRAAKEDDDLFEEYND